MEAKDRLIETLNISRKKLLTIVNVIDKQKEFYPGWTLRHFLAHLTGWDEAIATSLRAHASGNEPATPAVLGIDYYNAQSVAERTYLDLRQIMVEMELARNEVKAALLALPDDKFGQDVLFPWGRTDSVTELMNVLIYHDTEHAKELTALVKSTAPAETHALNTQTPTDAKT